MQEELKMHEKKEGKRNVGGCKQEYGGAGIKIRITSCSFVGTYHLTWLIGDISWLDTLGMTLLKGFKLSVCWNLSLDLW